MTIQNIVLLTATIRPPADVKNLQRTDVSLRLQDYIDALEFYISKLKAKEIEKIVFCDNSGHDLQVFEAMVEASAMQESVEIIGFKGLNYPPDFGRGYGEFKLVDYATKNSVILRSATRHANVWKITGRYKLANLQDLILTKDPNVDFYCNCKNYPSPWVDMYVLCWNEIAYKELISGIYVDLAETPDFPSAEIKFRKILDAERPVCRIGKRFRVTPILDGHRGIDNARYGSMRTKYLARVLARSIAPWFWI